MDRKKESVKKAIEQGSFPEIAYKYISFNHYTEDIFKNNELWFSKPNEFNDPFEFKIYDKGGYSREDIINFLILTGEVYSTDAVYLANITEDRLLKIIEESKEKVFEGKGVLCLSRIPDDILMWSHYSENHTGFVMGFNIKEDIDFFITPLNVIYQNDYPSISYLNEPNEIVNSCFRTKYLAWAYEQEIRIIKDAAGKHKFNKNALKEIFFGCKISSINKSNILKWVNDYGYQNVQFYDSKLSRTKYILEINKI